MDVSQLSKAICHQFNDASILIEGDDYHRLITVVSDQFLGLSRLARQQQLNKALMPFFQDGSLHAVTLKTLTLSESTNG